MPKYIHELKDWPKYKYDLATLLFNIEEVNTKRGRLFGILEAIGFESLQEHDIEALTEELVKSSAIEGERLDLETVKNSVARRLGVERGGIAGTDHYIEGLVEMAIDAAHNYNKPLTSERIFNWHAALFPTGRNAHGPVRVGDWRDDEKGPIAVTSIVKGREVIHYEAPDAERLHDDMNQFLNWFEASNEQSLVLKAGIAHLWFETIHPMDDGNGRIGRNIMDMMLARADQKSERPYSLSSQIHRDRNDYYNILEATQKGNGDYTDWLTWFVISLSKALDEATTTVGQAMSRTRFWQAIKEVELNDRQRKVISQILMGWEGKMTNKKYARLTDCSDATATRDLVDLVAKRILKTAAAGGRSTNYEIIARE